MKIIPKFKLENFQYTIISLFLIYVVFRFLFLTIDTKAIMDHMEFLARIITFVGALAISILIGVCSFEYVELSDEYFAYRNILFVTAKMNISNTLYLKCGDILNRNGSRYRCIVVSTKSIDSFEDECDMELVGDFNGSINRILKRKTKGNSMRISYDEKIINAFKDFYGDKIAN